MTTDPNSEMTYIPRRTERMQNYNAFEFARSNAQKRGMPLALHYHVNWFDFSEAQQQQPTYINFVRHPVERLISWYYYCRTPE